jgi:hypothetical protein
MKKGARGEGVRALQLSLQTLGYPLARFGADGWLGSESLDAVERWAEEHGFDSDSEGAIPKCLALAIVAAASAMSKVGGVASFPLVQDVREDAWKGAEKGKNPIRRIDTICLHQMACKDSDSIGWERWRKLAIHFVVTCGDNAAAYLLHDLDQKVWHGHGWNSRSVGFEFEGYFSGIGTDLKYFWKPKSRPDRRPMIPTEQQPEAGKQGCRFVIARIEKMGGKIKYVGAHRQSYGLKSSDPGELIWRGVALPIMEEFGLVQAPTLPNRKHPGKPIPAAWDARNEDIPY